MGPHKLARVHWEVGQTLLPEHFAAEGDALEAGIRLSAELSGLPSKGVATLAWDEVLLKAGSLSISTLVAVLPDGTVVDVPGNAAISGLSLADSGKSKVAVHLHVFNEDQDAVASGVQLYAADAPQVKREIRQLAVSMKPSLDDTRSSLKLAELVKGPGGVWALSPDFVPELLLVGPNPFLDPFLGDLDSLLAQARQQLRTEILDGVGSPNRLANARRTLFEVNRLQSVRLDMKEGVYPHPYVLFDALRRLYTEMACYLELNPDAMFPREIPAYHHDDLAGGLNAWKTLLQNGFRPEVAAETYRIFDRAPDLPNLVLAPLPPEVPHAGDLYLLVQRVESGKAVPLDGMKLASGKRLHLVRKRALSGIPYHHVKYPSFPHRFSADMDFYQLTKDEEWSYAVLENSLSLNVTPQLENAKVYLYWRKA